MGRRSESTKRLADVSDAGGLVGAPGEDDHDVRTARRGRSDRRRDRAHRGGRSHSWDEDREGRSLDTHHCHFYHCFNSDAQACQVRVTGIT